MKTMFTSLGRALGVALALGVLAGTGTVPRAEAQVRLRVTEPEDCRCVDKDGKPIENCSCVRIPEMGRVLRQALPTGRVRLGVTLADAEGGGNPRGAEVASVMKGGPADKAGIQAGDILTRVDGTSLLEPLDPDVERGFDAKASLPVQRLMEVVKGIEPGEKVEVEYLRGAQRSTVTLEARDLDTWSWTVVGPEWNPEAFQDRMKDLETRLKEMRIQVTPGEREIRIFGDSARAGRVIVREAPEARAFTLVTEDDERLWACPGKAASSGVWVGFGGRCVGGLELLELKPGLAEYFGTTTGVLVADVHADSKLGLQPGDVILAVGDRSVTDPERARRILSSYGADETVTLRIMRQKREMTVTGTLAK